MPQPKPSQRIIGVDGEGQGRKPHVYNFLAAADEFGKVWTVGQRATEQISTERCLDFLLELPTKCLVFGFAFLYDLTKILSDLPDRKLYLLFHPDKRQYMAESGRVQHSSVKWKGYKLNYVNRCFSVGADTRKVTVWDVFAFFQCKFTKACIDWKIGDAQTIAAMERMKERRGEFDTQSFEEVQAYCQMECLHLAKLGRELLDAHENAGIPLTEYYGAGSTAKSLMNRYDVRSYIDEIPEGMKEPVACAFFGGRFENSVIGPIRRPVWNADINSAYPYAATFLPCLTHGRWKYCRKNLDNEIERSRLALIEWTLPKLSQTDWQRSSWGPLPIRVLDGTIAFPASAYSGWTWKEEYISARMMRPDILPMSVWVYVTDCKCSPFSFLPEVYLERLRLGDDSRGIPLKLGPNSVYGKLVQSVGWKPPFQCWVWGGNITSRCRAQLLDAISASSSPARVLMLATDGVWSDERITLPNPVDTGTADATRITKGKKGALGAWDVKEYPRGVFAARPGIYFPLEPTEDELSKVRARGLGRRVLYERHAAVVDAYSRGLPSVTVPGGQRFIGAKTGVAMAGAKGIKRSEMYGEWIDWTVEVTFNPKPKRAFARKDGTLALWERFEAPSVPYDPALLTDEDKLLALAQLIGEEQPNGEYVEGDE